MWRRCCGGCDSVQAVWVPTSPILQSVSGRPQLLSNPQGLWPVWLQLILAMEVFDPDPNPWRKWGGLHSVRGIKPRFHPSLRTFHLSSGFLEPWALTCRSWLSSQAVQWFALVRRPIMSNAGDTPVVECLDARMVRRVLLSASLKIFPSSRQARIPFLRVLFSLSTPPLLSGWYTAVLMCLMDRTVRNSENSADANCGPLSVVTTLGRPQRPNRLSRRSMMECAEMELSWKTSGHFEWRSCTTSR